MSVSNYITFVNRFDLVKNVIYNIYHVFSVDMVHKWFYISFIREHFMTVV